MLGPVRQLLPAGAYIYQFKINSKAPFVGAGWSWHQDYAAWRLADGLPRPDLVNVGVFFDDVSEFNGPVVVVPGSHRDGLVTKAPAPASPASHQHVDPQDIALTPEDMRTLVRRLGMRSVTGPAGTVVLFHPEIVHGSATNMSPYPRRLLIVTYNDVRNMPRYAGQPRSAYVVGRDTEPLQPEDLPLAVPALADSAVGVPA
jgi:ectoine hydroxylase